MEIPTSPIFTPDENSKLQKLAEDEGNRIIDGGIDKEAKKFFDAEKYRPSLEKVLADRETHGIIFKYAKKLCPEIDAVYFTAFLHNPIDNNIRNLSPEYDKLRGLYKLSDAQPDLYLHVTPEKSTFATGSCLSKSDKQFIMHPWQVSLKTWKNSHNYRIYAISTTLACEYLAHSKYAAKADKVSRTHLPINPADLIVFYKNSVENVLKKSNFRPINRKIPSLQSLGIQVS